MRVLRVRPATGEVNAKKVLELGEGSTEVQLIIIARELGFNAF